MAIRVQARDCVVDSADIDVAVSGLNVDSRCFGLGGDVRRRLAEGERSHEKEHCEVRFHWFPFPGEENGLPVLRATHALGSSDP